MLKLYYSDISYHALNYVAQNKFKIWKLMMINFAYNTGHLVYSGYKIIKPDWINNSCALLMLESLPIVPCETKFKWNKEMINKITSDDIKSANIMTNTYHNLHYWKLNIMGYMLFLTNIMILYGGYTAVRQMFSF